MSNFRSISYFFAISVAVIPKGTTHEFWKSVHAGAAQAAKEANAELIWKGPLREDDRSAQIDLVEMMSTRGVSGIVLAPLDDSALRAPVENAVRGGSPVVIIDSDLKSQNYVSFVATDNYKGGKLAGRHMAALLGGKGSVAVLRYAEGSASSAQREQGFLDEIKSHPGIKVVSSNQYGGVTTETAYKASENLMASIKPDGVFCPNESTTFGMLRALQDGGQAGKIKLVGFDASVKLLEALENGQIQGLVVQDPTKMGYLGVKTLLEHLQGKKVERRIDTGATLVTKANFKDPKVQKLWRN